jgi:tRNA A-37 threonylcarbamoyl transferase component Bud32
MSREAQTARLRVLERPAAPSSATPPLKILIVHDDLAIRLRLAEMLAPHCPAAVIDSSTQAAALELRGKLRDYAAAIVIVDFAASPSVAEALGIVTALRAGSRALALTVIGRNGHERSAVEALRVGAIDYWSLHHVDAAALVATLRSHFVSSEARAAEAPPVIAGYRLLKELARSPRATLYLADSEELGTQVAIKVHGHRQQQETSETEQERFLRECRLLSQMNHRAIADVYDFGVTDECHWLAMEYFAAGSLKARLQNPLAETEAIAYAFQVGSALRVIHAAGVVHRDLKPSNIMLRADDSLALIDFGLARPAAAASDVTSPNVRVGSPAYMAPEQIQGSPPDERCDLYALGVICFEMLTAGLPFNAPTIAQLLDLQLKAAPPPLPPKLARYQAVLDGLLAKRPKDRLGSADQFLEALATASGHVPTRRNA